MLTVQKHQPVLRRLPIPRDVSLPAAPGKVTVLLGRNGVGKTTLLKSLMGLVPIKSGSITFDGQPIHHQAPPDRARAGIGFVPQGREILAASPWKTTCAWAWPTKAAAPRARAPLHPVPGAQANAGRRGGDLSGGQQQQLAIARALAPSPRLLILDEPTEGIQPSIIKDIGRVIRQLADEGLDGHPWPCCCASSTTILPRNRPTNTW